MTAHLLGFHIVSPSSVERPFAHDAVAGLISSAIGEPVDITTDVGPGWTKLIVRMSAAQLAKHGTPPMAALFESVCEAAGAHFARTFGKDEWALVEDGELAGSINAIDWMQYFGPRFGDWLASKGKSRLVSARTTGRGAQIVTLAIDPLTGSWVQRQDAASALYIELRPLPAAAHSEVDPDIRLQQALPPEPAQWEPRQRRAMLDARVRTIKAIEAAVADARLCDRFRQTYLPGKIDEPLLDRIATWLPHYGGESTGAAFRSVARLHETQVGAAPLDAIALEGYVKMVSWGGDDLPLATREYLVEHIGTLAEPSPAVFARNAYDRDVVRGMLKLAMAMARTCTCPRCQLRNKRLDETLGT